MRNRSLTSLVSIVGELKKNACYKIETLELELVLGHCSDGFDDVAFHCLLIFSPSLLQVIAGPGFRKRFHQL